MAKIVIKSKVKKIKRKFPVQIIAPEFLSSKVLGSTNATNLSSLVGKNIKMNMKYVTGNVKNQNVWLTFNISEVSSGKALTSIRNYEQIAYYLGRFVKVNSDLIEDSFIYNLKDGKQIRVKPFVITKENTSSLVIRSFRAKIRELVTKEAKSKTLEEFFSSVLSSKMQMGLRAEVKKIFPVKAFEFKKVELISNNKNDN